MTCLWPHRVRYPFARRMAARLAITGLRFALYERVLAGDPVSPRAISSS
jgi:hypothetical protein